MPPSFKGKSERTAGARRSAAPRAIPTKSRNRAIRTASTTRRGTSIGAAAWRVAVLRSTSDPVRYCGALSFGDREAELLPGVPRPELPLVRPKEHIGNPLGSKKGPDFLIGHLAAIQRSNDLLLRRRARSYSSVAEVHRVSPQGRHRRPGFE